MTETVAGLKRFPLLASLTEPELEVLLGHATAQRLARGEYLFREGEPGDALYLLCEGVCVAERVIDPRAGTTKDLAILPATAFVGEMALSDHAPRSASVRAEIPSRVLRISRESFARLIDESPLVASKIFRALFRETTERLRATNDELVAVYEVARFLASGSDARATAQLVLDGLLGRLGATVALVAFYQPKSNGLEVVRACGPRAEGLVGLTIPLGDGLPARAFDERRPLLVERLLGGTEPWESSSLLLVPLVVRDRAQGLLLLGEPVSGQPYRVPDLSLTTAVANISAPVLLEAFGPPS